jgi:death-on-curing family protein
VRKNVILYLNAERAIILHDELMQSFNETRCGLASREMLESALARPQNAAIYENADIVRQTASLYFGLVKNRIWRGGNKRTATILIKEFLEINNLQANWTLEDVMRLGRNVDTDVWKIDEIEKWLRDRII